MATKQMFPIADLSPVDVAFGCPDRIDTLMPAYENIPREFKDGRGWQNQLMNAWFFSGVKNLKLTPREGVDQNKALRHIKAVLGSFAPKHEHKEAAVAYLLDQWFSAGTWERGK